MRLMIVIAALMPGLAIAAEPVSLSSKVEVERTAIVAGQPKTTLQEPTIVTPGEKLVFTTTYRNSGAKPVQRFVVTNPVPASVVFQSVSGPQATVSVDGGRSWGQLAALRKATDEGGNRPARAEDVTHIRWTIPSIAPGSAGVLLYRGNVR